MRALGGNMAGLESGPGEECAETRPGSPVCEWWLPGNRPEAQSHHEGVKRRCLCSVVRRSIHKSRHNPGKQERNLSPSAPVIFGGITPVLTHATADENEGAHAGSVRPPRWSRESGDRAEGVSPTESAWIGVPSFPGNHPWAAAPHDGRKGVVSSRAPACPRLWVFRVSAVVPCPRGIIGVNQRRSASLIFEGITQCARAHHEG